MATALRIPVLVMAACVALACSDPTAFIDAGSPQLQLEHPGPTRVSGNAVIATAFFPDGQITVAVGGIVTPSGDTFGNVVIDQDYFTRTRRLHRLVPPSLDRDWWCIDAADEPVVDGGFTVFVRDVGDGQSSLDQVAFTIGISTIHCPLPGEFFGEALTFAPLLSGDFRFER